MNPAEIICKLMNQAREPLTILPSPAALESWTAQGNFILQLDASGPPVGYLLHENVSDQKTMYVNHASLDLNARHRSSAAAAIARLVTRAETAKATTVLFSCNADLATIEFWKDCAFVAIAATPSLVQAHRMIVQLEKRLPCRQQELAGRTPPDSRRPNA